MWRKVFSEFGDGGYDACIWNDVNTLVSPFPSSDESEYCIGSNCLLLEYYLRYSCLGRSLPQVFDGTALDRKATERNRCKDMSLSRSPRDDLFVWYGVRTLGTRQQHHSMGGDEAVLCIGICSTLLCKRGTWSSSSNCEPLDKPGATGEFGRQDVFRSGPMGTFDLPRIWRHQHVWWNEHYGLEWFSFVREVVVYGAVCWVGINPIQGVVFGQGHGFAGIINAMRTSECQRSTYSI